ncbi:MAG TPA: hypothetical protein VE988_17655 [Gemmataceae bacterium]|nr:hypothetical protein [Gemmataceae bacterium]
MGPGKKIGHYLLTCILVMSGASVAVCQDGAARLGAPIVGGQLPFPIDGGLSLGAPVVGGQTPFPIDGSPSADPLGNCAVCPGPLDAPQNNSTLFSGNHGFDHFIGFISNPTQSIDPRALTEIYPIFGAGWASGSGPLLPEANVQLYGAGLTVALSDRFAVGLNQGGYAVMDINSNRERLRDKLGLPIHDRDRGGQREGWLNLGGFGQYTLIADVPNQFILTAGMRWEAPSGTEQVFQGGANPTYLSPYLTAGQAIGCCHILGTGGFEFPLGDGTVTTDTFYLNLHVDRQIGWFYPLVELNGSYHTKSTDLTLPTRHGVIDLGTFTSTNNILGIAVGADAVLIPGKLEIGAVYVRPITSEDRFDFNSMLFKMTYRF